MNPLETLAIELVANVKGFVTDANKAIDKVEKNATDSFGKIEKKAAGSFGKVGKAITGAVGGAALGFAVGTLGKRFAELDQTMAGVAARAGLTADQQDKLTDSTIKLSKANLQSQTEIALTGEALISLQGVEADNQEQIEKLTQQYLDYALVTGQTAPDAVAAFDDILDAWNLTAEDGITIMDALVVSHQKFGTDVVGAQGALNKYASTFQTLGLDVNDAIGYINLFAASGVDAESASTAFTKAVGLLTDGTDASNKKLAEMATNLGLTNEQLEAFKTGDPATQFDILTKAIADMEDPTLRAQAAIDLFGAKAGPKMAEALAGNGIEDFKINMDAAGGASELAANKIQGTLINKLKLLGNEITGRAMEITQQFAPALMLLGNPQITSAIGTLVGALAGIKLPNLSGIMDVASQGAQGTFNLAQTITQTIVQVGKNVLDAGIDVIQHITQRITKVTVAPTAEADVAKAGGASATKFTAAFTKAFESVGFGAMGTIIGNGLATIIWRASLQGFIAGALKAGPIGALAVAAAIVAALTALNWYQVFGELKAGDFGTALVQVLIGPSNALGTLFGVNVAKEITSGLSSLGQTILDAVVSSVTAFFTPENIGARLADLVAIALTGLFIVPILLIHFRQPIADMFEMIGRLIVEAAIAFPALLAGVGTLFVSALTDVLTAKIPIVGVKVWEAIAGYLFPAPAVVYEFFKKGLGGPLLDFLDDLPGLAQEGLTRTGEGIGFFFTDILPALLTGEYLPVLATTFVDFFGTTLPDLITIEAPKIPGAVLDALVDLPGLVLESLELVTEKVTGWVGGLESWLSENFSPWNWIKAAAGAFVDEIVGWLALIWGSGIITEWVTDLSNWLTTNFNPWTWIKVATDLLTTEVGVVLDGIVTLFTTAGTDAMAGLKTGAELGFAALRIFFFDLPTKIGEWIGDTATWLSGKGEDLIEGFILGAIEKIKSIPERVVKKAKDTIETAATGFGLWGSPSPWMRGRGRDLIQGYVDGAHAAMGSVTGVISEMADTIKRGVSGGGGDGGWAGIGKRIGEAVQKGFSTGNTDGGWAGVGQAAGAAIAGGMQGAIGGIAKVVGEGMQGVAGVVSREAQGVQDALDHVAAGAGSMHDALLLANAGFVDMANGIVQLNLGLISSADLIAIYNGGVTETVDAVAQALANYDLLASAVEMAHDKTLGMHEAQLLAQAGFEGLGVAIRDYNLGLIDADELTRQVEATFTEVATSAAVLGAQWTTAFADAMGREDLLEAVGSAGVRILDQLDKVLTEGGQKNVETLAGMVASMLTELESTLPADEAATLGETITDALQEAIEKGTPEAIQAVVELLDGANEAMENGTTTILTSVGKFNVLLGNKIADKALQDKVGKNGADLMGALDLAISTGGEKGVETMASEAFAIVEAMGKELEPGQADYLGGVLMGALQTALETGGEGAVQAVIDILAQIQAMIDGAPTTIPAPKLEGAPAAPVKGGGGGGSDDGAHGTTTPPKSKTPSGYNNLSPLENIIGFFDGTVGSNRAPRGMIESFVLSMKRLFDNWAQWVATVERQGISVPASLHKDLERYGLPKSFDEGGALMPGLTFAWNGTGVPEQVIAPGAGGSSSRVTNYGRIIQVFGPGRQSKDVIRDLDKLLA